MKKRRLGRSDLEVVPFCFGGNVFGWTADEKTSFALLDRFVEAGFNFIDTADAYSRWVPGHTGGEFETIIGTLDEAARQSRQGHRSRPRSAPTWAAAARMAPSYVRKAVEDSLKRLQTDRIDLYQTHWDDEKTPLEEVLSTYAELIKAGKVRAIGASNYSAARLKEALDISARKGLPRYESLQPQYNLVERKAYEAELGPLCRKEQIGVIPYYSLASGFLTGKYRGKQDARQKPARRRRDQISRRQRGSRPRRARRGGRRAYSDGGADRAGLAPRQARNHRADRQRDQPDSAR